MMLRHWEGAHGENIGRKEVIQKKTDIRMVEEEEKYIRLAAIGNQTRGSERKYRSTAKEEDIESRGR